MGQLHTLHAVFHHEVTVVDVGPSIISAHQVGLFITVVLAGGLTGVESTYLPVCLIGIIPTVELPPVTVIHVDSSIRAAYRADSLGAI